MNTKIRTTGTISPFMRKLKKLGLVMAGVGAVIIAAPVSLPAIVITAGGYIALAGGILVTAAQPLPARLRSLFV